MKLRTDVVVMYREIHGWVGIVSGLMLFVAFYAGAITMFEEPLRRWSSPPTTLAPPPPLSRTAELVAKTLAAHPEAGRRYDIHLETGPAEPARLSWTTGGRGDDEDAPRRTFYASLDANGRLEATERGPSGAALFIDMLHQKVGLPVPREVAMPIMGAVALLYAIAIVSGVIVLLPSLVDDLFAVRIGRNVKRMWLDLHNVIGLFSLPFHLVMALTSVVFAFHDQFYDAQGAAFGLARSDRPAAHAPPPDRMPLPVQAVVARVRAQAPGFEPRTLTYAKGKDGALSLRVAGGDPHYGTRGPTFGFAGVDPYDGRIVDTDYLPGHQDGWGATVSSFFALHFGSFGGDAIRWSYFALGLAGAFLFYTGNLLWIESRRKRERKAGAVEQTRSTRTLGALTVGVPLGCVAGINAVLAAARLGSDADAWAYYVVFASFVAFALIRGAGRGGTELSIATVVSMLLVPIADLTATSPEFIDPVIDMIAMAGAAILALTAISARRRAVDGKRDSVWSVRKPLR